MPRQELKMTFDPNTIEHLGVRMYSTLPPVLAELIANSYDADAENIKLNLKDDTADKEITIEDDGLGMSFDDINNKFLRIGRNRRDDGDDPASAKGRKAIGKKGLGKLSFFGISHEIEIATKKDGKLNVFIMRWEDIKGADKEYTPVIVKKDETCGAAEHGTTITLRKLQRDSNFLPEDIATSLSKIFIIDASFKITLQHNSWAPIEVTNERKYADLDKEIEWDVPADIGMESDYARKAQVIGHLIATEKPISPKTNMRGVVLFSRNKLVNQAEYFSDSESSHFFSYLTGWLEVDFIDDLPEDVIETNRQSLIWDHPEMAELRTYLQSVIRWLERDWRNKRAAKRETKLSETTGVNIPEWFSKLPTEIRDQVKPLIQTLERDSELPVEAMGSAVKKIHGLIPEYAFYHWRYMHPEVQKASKQYYEDENYYTAFLETAKVYINAVKSKSGSTITDAAPMMENVFQLATPVLSVTENFKRTDGTDFDPDTIKNIKNAHREFSHGIVVGGRNVVAHEVVSDLKDSGLFTEKDCLDALSLLSHLFYRLDRSTKMTP
ncbi:MAG: TIGR02391 family protein [Candidatus Paceibacterota bacterium]